MCQDTASIDELLEKLHLTKYREKFLQSEKVKNVDDFKKYMDHPEYLKEMGLTVFEARRFKRLFSSTFQEMVKTNLLLVENEVARDTHLTQEFKSIGINKQKSRPLLSVRYKCLTKEGIICNQINEISFDESILFYELVSKIYHVLKEIIQDICFTSVELYSLTGYPLAINPGIYLQPISNWGLHAHELIYVYPKNLNTNYEFQSNVDCEEFVIIIELQNSDFTKELRFYRDCVTIKDIKVFLSMEIHVFEDNITIWHYCLKKELTEIVKDKKEYVRKSFKDCKLVFSLSDTYSDNDLSAFRTDYTSCYSFKSLEDFHTVNAYLLYLVREHREKGNRDTLLRKLGLLRKISCSPPLVYALYLLFNDYSTSLPHKLAINEGLITSISLISSSTDPPTISKFGELWLHIEEHAFKFDFSLTEIYETTSVSKQMRDNPRKNINRTVIQAFTPNQNIIITWRNAPSTHDAFCYSPQTRLQDFTGNVETRFLLQHAVELYIQFLENGQSYGLIRPLIKDLKSNCVFLGSTKYGYFNYFSPEDGICHSANSWTNTVPYIGPSLLSDEESNSYPLMIILLDMSRDMMGIYGQPNNEENNLVSKVLIFVDLLLDELVRMRYKYLLGAIVFSDSHNFRNGYREIHPPSFEYQHIYEELVNTVKKQFHFQSKSNCKGILTKALNNIFPKYSGNKNEKIVNIFTNSNQDEKNKYDASRFKRDLCKESVNFIVNTIIFDGHGHDIEKLSKLTDGFHICFDTVKKNFYQSHEKEIYGSKDMNLNHIVDLQNKLTYPENIRLKDSYKIIQSKLSKQRITTPLELFDEKNKDQSTYNRNIAGYTKSSWFHILKQITKFMRNPNPHCRIYSTQDNILKWLLLFRCPNDLNRSIIWLTELEFGANYPQSAPSICCLTPVYHPNVTPTGRICHPILFEDYNPNVSLGEIIDHLVELMVQPIITHAVEYEMFEIFLSKKDFFSKMSIHCAVVNLIPQSFEEIEKDLNVKDPAFTPQQGILACPLTKQLFTSPVTTPEGRTYEQNAILQYLKTNPRDPFSNNPLEAKQLISNQAIASAVYKYKLDNPVKLYWWEK